MKGPQKILNLELTGLKYGSLQQYLYVIHVNNAFANNGVFQ